MNTSLLRVFLAMWSSLHALSLVAQEEGEGRPSRWREAICGQIVVVKTEGWENTTGTMSCFSKENRNWVKQAGPIEVTVGRKGLGIGVGLHPTGLAGPRKQEGDKRAPAGIFVLEFGFGAKPFTTKKFPYYQSTPEDLWIDDPNSRYYNQWVRSNDPKIRKDWTSAEILRRPDGIYDYAIAVAHNRDPVIKGNGSAIFIHSWFGRGIPTIGCTAMEKEEVKSLLRWLDQSKNPVLFQGPVDFMEKLALPDGLLSE